SRSDLVRDHLHNIGAIVRRTHEPSNRAHAVTGARPSLRELLSAVRGFVGHEPDISLPRRIGERRQLAAVTYPLDAVEAAGHEHGATVNDLVLAAVTSGLRRMLI